MKTNINIAKVYASGFSRSAFLDVLDFHDYSQFDDLYQTYDLGKKSYDSYLSYLGHLYSEMLRKYRCEYVYKNELINYLIKTYSTSNFAEPYNEFRVGKSIADLALFNGESKAFEIKTEYDSPQRLKGQLNSYRQLFDKCYIVVPIEKVKMYETLIDENMGIISLEKKARSVFIEEERSAKQNELFDVELMMSCLRTKEYEEIIKERFGELPKVPMYEMYDACLDLMREIEVDELRKTFVKKVKARRHLTKILKEMPKIIRQMCLSLTLTEKRAAQLIDRLNEPLKH